MWPLMDIVAKTVNSKWFQFFRWSRFKNISSFSLTIYEKNPCPDQFTRFFSKWLIIHQLEGSYDQWLSGFYWLKFILFYLLIILCKTAHFLCTSLDQFSGVLPLMSTLFSHQCYTGQKYVSNTTPLLNLCTFVYSSVWVASDFRLIYWNSCGNPSTGNGLEAETMWFLWHTPMHSDFYENRWMHLFRLL